MPIATVKEYKISLIVKDISFDILYQDSGSGVVVSKCIMNIFWRYSWQDFLRWTMAMRIVKDASNIFDHDDWKNDFLWKKRL